MKVGTRLLTIVPLSIALLTVFSGGALAAHTQNQGYVAAGSNLSAVVWENPLGLPVSLGAVITPEEMAGQQPSSISVDDLGGGPVPFIVCQDTDSDATCRWGANSPDTNVIACASSADLTGETWDTGQDVLVFVLQEDFTAPVFGRTPCTTPGTAGVLSVTFGS